MDKLASAPGHEGELHTPMIAIEFGLVKSWAIVDTGADITVMSEELYRQVPEQNKGPLQEGKNSNGNIVGVSGKPLHSLVLFMYPRHSFVPYHIPF